MIFLFNLPLTVILHTFFQHFVAVQNLHIEEALIYKTKTAAQIKEEFKPMWAKMKKQLKKDYVYYPLLAGPLAPRLATLDNFGAIFATPSFIDSFVKSFQLAAITAASLLPPATSARRSTTRRTRCAAPALAAMP